MNLLFIRQNFLAQYRHLVAALQREGYCCILIDGHGAAGLSPKQRLKLLVAE